MAVFIKKSRWRDKIVLMFLLLKKWFLQDFLAINKIGCFDLWLFNDNYS